MMDVSSGGLINNELWALGWIPSETSGWEPSQPKIKHMWFVITTISIKNLMDHKYITVPWDHSNLKVTWNMDTPLLTRGENLHAYKNPALWQKGGSNWVFFLLILLWQWKKDWILMSKLWRKISVAKLPCACTGISQDPSSRKRLWRHCHATSSPGGNLTARARGHGVRAPRGGRFDTGATIREVGEEGHNEGRNDRKATHFKLYTLAWSTWIYLFVRKLSWGWFWMILFASSTNDSI